MSLRIEALTIDPDDSSLETTLFEEIPPGNLYPFSQLLPGQRSDGAQMYMAFCEKDNSESIIYLAKVPEKEFYSLMEADGLCVNEQLIEILKLKTGEVHEWTVKMTEEMPRTMLVFKHIA